MKLKKSAVAATLLSLVIGFFSGTGFKLIYELNAFQPYEWAVTDPPIILNCYGKEFSKLQRTTDSESVVRAEQEGFEPPVLSYDGFQNRCLKPDSATAPKRSSSYQLYGNLAHIL